MLDVSDKGIIVLEASHIFPIGFFVDVYLSRFKMFREFIINLRSPQWHVMVNYSACNPEI